MKKLSGKDIKEFLQVEWDRRLRKLDKLNQLKNELDVYIKPKVKKNKISKSLISPGLVVTNKKTKIKYDVRSIDNNDLIFLSSPEGEDIKVTLNSFDKDFYLD